MTVAPATAALRSALCAVLGVVSLSAIATADAAPSPLQGATSQARSAVSETSRVSTVWSWPLVPVPRVVHPFVRPPTPYGAGHRGIDVAGSPGAPVLAVDDGLVTHVGVLAGRGTVTVQHAGALRSTYEPVAATVTLGQAVTRGSPIGTLDLASSHCAPAACLHLGALRQGSPRIWEYVDPLLFLRSVEIVLLPTG